MCATQDAASSDSDLKAKLLSVERNLEQLERQLSEAEKSVTLSNATVREAHSRSEQLEKELGEARNTIAALEASGNILSAHADKQIDSQHSSPDSRSSVLQEVCLCWNI